jgi:hypothetical protein
MQKQNPQSDTVFRTLVIGLLAVLAIAVLVTGTFLNAKVNQLGDAMINGLEAQNEITFYRNGGTEIITYSFSDPVVPMTETYSSSGTYLWTEHVFIEAEKDSQGVLLVANKPDSTLVHNPAAIARYGLAMYSNYLELGGEAYLTEARAQADYLIETMEPETGALKFDYPGSLGYGDPPTIVAAPWVSAEAQGLAGSLLSRMYDLTSEDRYRNAAQLVLKPLEVDVADGGVARDFFGSTIYETYPTATVNFNLNGHLSAVIGAFDVWKLTGNAQAQALYRQGVSATEAALPFFDSRGISLYDLSHLFNSPADIQMPDTKFHPLRISQLEIINQEAESETIGFYISLWTAYVNGSSQ